jgi:hypothetical protein
MDTHPGLLGHGDQRQPIEWVTTTRLLGRPSVPERRQCLRYSVEQLPCRSRQEKNGVVVETEKCGGGCDFSHVWHASDVHGSTILCTPQNKEEKFLWTSASDIKITDVEYFERLFSLSV